MEVSFGLSAFSKLILHVTKYPEYFVNGVLLSKAGDESTSTAGGAGEPNGGVEGVTTTKKAVYKFQETIPLLHLSKYVTPSMEVALAQVEQHCKRTGQVVSGYYQANESLSDDQPDFVAQRIAEKLAELNPRILILMVKNSEVDSNLASIPFNFYRIGGGADGGGGKLKAVEEESLTIRLQPDEQGALSTVSALIQSKIYEKLMDFDNHMDDLAADYWSNAEVNEQIERLS